jgi:hypothetical protein
LEVRGQADPRLAIAPAGDRGNERGGEDEGEDCEPAADAGQDARIRAP